MKAPMLPYGLRFAPTDPRFDAAVVDLRRRVAQEALFSDKRIEELRGCAFEWATFLSDAKVRTHRIETLLRHVPELVDVARLLKYFRRAVDEQNMALAAAVRSHPFSGELPPLVSHREVAFALAAEFAWAPALWHSRCDRNHFMHLDENHCMHVHRTAVGYILKDNAGGYPGPLGRGDGLRLAIQSGIRFLGYDYLPGGGAHSSPFDQIPWGQPWTGNTQL
jgi:hypothetical protein